ncbi:MAG TPA: hypothetical protein VMA32_15985 [Streptosporangiaceae bacterium]|nr:hypothetical protein [Streptosporangiaceae bacterium]
MSTEITAPAMTTALADPAIPVRAHSRVVKKLGHWTSARQFDVRASRGLVVLDLRSPQIASGDIEVSLDIDHAVVKLLVADGAVIDDGSARRIGRCRIRDWTGVSGADGRRVVLSGEMRSAEVRVHRGGVAILSAMCSREYLADALAAHRAGRRPTVDDPTRSAGDAR